MTLTSGRITALKIFSTLLGCLGLHLILKDFGYGRIVHDIQGLGLAFVPVVACFIFLFTLLSLAWWILTGQSISYYYLFKVSLVANAWNNIGPVSKSMGEPTRVILLTDRMSSREAIRSMIIYNLAQAMGTVTTFGIGAALAPFLFPLTSGAFMVTMASAMAAFMINGLAVYWILTRPRKGRPSRGRSLRGVLHWMRWISHQLKKYTRHNPGRYFGAVGLTALGRLSEGLVFFVIFRALGAPLSVVESLAIDIGRGIADNVFFFVPYQLGTREYSLVYITQSVIGKATESALAASLVFRLGEIAWIVGGFLLGVWMLKGRHPQKD